MIDSTLLASIKRLEMKARRVLDDRALGQYTSAFKGQGMEFDEVREYQVGDEMRFIDWNVTARMGHPYVKVFRQERSLTVHLVVDISASQSFGSGQRSKRELAAQLAAMLVLLAAKQHDSVSLSLVSDRVECYLPIQKAKGPSTAWHMIHKILAHNAQSRKTDLSVVADALMRRSVRRGLVIFISDFCSDAISPQLFIPLAKRHDLLALVTSDRKQYQLPPFGGFLLEDAESGTRYLAKRGILNHAPSFNLESEQQEKIARDLKSVAMDFGFFYPEEDPVAPLVQLLARHGGRARL